MPTVLRHRHPGYYRPRLEEEWGGDHGEIRSPKQAADNALAKAIWEKLQYHYPGHPWFVGVNHELGMAVIKLPLFTEWGYWIRLDDLAVDPGMRIVKKGGGEFLERYNLPRSTIDLAALVGALKRFQPRLTSKLLPD